MQQPQDTVSSHIIEVNNITYRFLIKNLDKSKNGVIIFFTSAKGQTPRSKNIFPYYTRLSWADSLANYTSIFVADPFELSPLCNESCGSWFIGSNGQSLLPIISQLLLNIIGDEHGPLLTYGSSMGGYAALLSAFYLKADSVIAECPQLILSTYLSAKKYLEKINDVNMQYINVFDFFNQQPIHFSTEILLNIGDSVHIKQLSTILCDAKYKNLLRSLNINILIYSSKNNFGHTVIPKDDAIKKIIQHLSNQYNI